MEFEGKGEGKGEREGEGRGGDGERKGGEEGEREERKEGRVKVRGRKMGKDNSRMVEAYCRRRGEVGFWHDVSAKVRLAQPLEAGLHHAAPPIINTAPGVGAGAGTQDGGWVTYCRTQLKTWRSNLSDVHHPSSAGMPPR